MQAFWVTLILPLVSTVTVVPIPLSPGDAPSVNGNLLSLSIEQDRWLDWSGNTTRNSFFFNTLDNLVVITGDNPTIRIGSTRALPCSLSSADDDGFLSRGNIRRRRPWVLSGKWPGAKFLPPGTGVTWGVNFGGKNLTAVFLETQAIVNAFASPAIQNAGITLDFLELGRAGNEADLYSNNGLRASTYNVSQYTTEWITFATNMSLTANLAGSDTRIWGAAFAGSSHTTTGFSPQGIFANNILASAPGKFIDTISQHHYSGSFCTGNAGLLQDLMTKATIRSNLSAFIPDIQATQNKGLDYVFGEINSYSSNPASLITPYLGRKSVSPGCSSTKESGTNTTWQVPSSAQLCLFSTANQIQPETLTMSTLDGHVLDPPLQPHIQPQYYAAIIIAEAIGDSGNTQALEFNINDSRISGYGFYESGTLKRAVFINSLAFLSGTTTRPSTHLNLTFSGSGTEPTSFSLKRLVIGHATDGSGLTYGGQTYETSDARVGGTLMPENGTVSAGIDIPATQAILVSFN
ncbi:glycoside hydrolase family 79 protein [Mycena metata]|uniref:Glycoside hydrolase family 79 protein n=1 Tax=Mycena metata TaxID=1033252 RepID=A0AAD7NSU1_9AGAR|nr:glycoside hydrolase family 79 protein [Mycena metata]